MEAEERRGHPRVIERMLREPRRVSLFQAVRLLELWRSEAARVGHSGPPRDEAVRFRAEASLSHPRTGVTAVDEVRGDPDLPPKYRITQVLVGLYGTLSPLPEAYTEEIVERLAGRGGETADDPVRSFLDLFNHRLVSLLYRGWARSRPEATFERSGDDSVTQMILCIMGMDPQVRLVDSTLDRLSASRYAAFFARRTRSAESLERMVSDLLDGTPVRVEPFVLRQVLIPESAQCRLGLSGTTLDRDCMLGAAAPDRAGKIRLWIGPTDRSQYVELGPGGRLRAVLGDLLRIYLRDATEHDAMIGILGQAKPSLRLGEPESRLGIDAWLPEAEPRDSWELLAGFRRPERSEGSIH